MKWEVIVVDNNSSDATKETTHWFCDSYPERYKYIFEERQGKSYALNAGIAQSRGEILVFTDDDVVVHSDWLTEIKTTFDRFHCSAVGGRIVPTWDSGIPSWYDNPYGPWNRDNMKICGPIVEFDLGEDPAPIHIPPEEPMLPYGDPCLKNMVSTGKIWVLAGRIQMAGVKTWRCVCE